MKHKYLILFTTFILLSVVGQVSSIAQTTSCSAIPTICMYSRNVSLVSVNSSNYWGTYLYSDYPNLGTILSGAYVPYLTTYNSSYANGLIWQYNQTYSGSTYNATYDKPHYLYDSLNQIVIDAINYIMYQSDGTQSIDIDTQILTGLGNDSIKWADRTLHRANGTIILNYNNELSSPLFAQTNCDVKSYSNGSLYCSNDIYYYNQTYSGNTYNSTYAGLINNVSYLSTYNATYNLWTYNQTIPALNSYNWNLSGSNLFTKDLTYNVGIGTASPSNPLHVQSSGSSYIAKFQNINSSSGVTDSRGVVIIIGNSNETNTGFASGRGGGGLLLQNINGSNNTYSPIGFYDAGGQAIASIIGIQKSDVNNDGELTFTTRNANGLSEAMRISNNQRVLIGATTETNYNRLVVKENNNANLRLSGTGETDGAGLLIGAIQEGDNTNEWFIGGGIDYNASSGGILNLTSRTTSATWIHSDNNEWKLFVNNSIADNSIFSYNDNLPSIYVTQVSTGLKVAIGGVSAIPNVAGVTLLTNGSIATMKDGDGYYTGLSRDFFIGYNGSALLIDRQAGSGNIIIPDSLNVGIGISSPTRTLDISGTMALIGDNKTFDFTGSDGVGNDIAFFYQEGTPNALYIRDRGSSVNRVKFEKTGNVGIGTNTPTQLLDVRGIGNFSGTIYINNGTDVSTTKELSYIKVNNTFTTNLNLTYANYTNFLSIPLVASTNYSISCIFIGDAAASTTGLWVNSSLNTNYTFNTQSWFMSGGTTVYGSSACVNLTSCNTLALSSNSGVDIPINYDGYIENKLTGTLSFGLSTEINGSAVSIYRSGCEVKTL